MKKKLITTLFITLGMLSAPAVHAGHWVYQETITDPETGDMYEVYHCEKKFLSIGCRVGDILARPVATISPA